MSGLGFDEFFKKVRDQGDPSVHFRAVKKRSLAQERPGAEVGDDRAPLRVPAAMADVDLPEAGSAGRMVDGREPSGGLDQDRLADDDSRHAMRPPRFDGPFSYVSPRARFRPSYGARMAAGYMSFGRRESSGAQSSGPPSFHPVTSWGHVGEWNDS